MLLFIGNALHEIHKKLLIGGLSFQMLKNLQTEIFWRDIISFYSKKWNYRPFQVMDNQIVFGFNIFILNFQSLDPHRLGHY